MPPLTAEDGLLDGDTLLLSVAFTCYAKNVIAFRNQSRKTEEHHFVTLKSLVGYLGDLPVSSLSFDKVRDWKLSLEARNLSALTIRGYLTRLRVVLGYLESKGYSVLSPTHIPLPKRSNKVPSVLNAVEVQLLIDSTDKLRNKALLSLIYSAGLRVSEVCALDRDDVKNDCFNLVGKGGKDRLCFIDSRARYYLNKYLEQRTSGYDVMVNIRGVPTNKIRYHVPGDALKALFITPQTNERITASTVQEVVKRASKKAGFDWPVHPHTLRHSFATNLMINGIDLYQLSKLMGHSSIATTQVYLHVSDKHLAEDYEKYHTV